LKNQALFAGVTCLVLGGLLGFLVGQEVERSRKTPVRVESNVEPGRANSNTPQLPEGHPPIPSPQEIETLKKTVGNAPQDLALLTELANKLYDGGHYGEAVEYYRRILTMEPGNIGVSTDLGTALFYSGKPDEAITQFNQSLKIDPRHAQTLHNLVVVYLQGKRDVKAAGDALDRLAAVDPANPSLPALRKMLAAGNSGTGKSNPRQSIF
jgi:hypothetical protein